MKKYKTAVYKRISDFYHKLKFKTHYLLSLSNLIKVIKTEVFQS
jgi:hypothetical protein